MKRKVCTLVTIVCVAFLSVASLGAAVKKEERSKFKMAGPLGKMMGMFMGRKMREGIVSTTAVKGDRKLTRSGDTGQLVDLKEEKVYDIDFKKKTYTVMTFEEVRQKFLEAQAKMKEQQAKMEEERAKHPDQKMPEYDFEVTNKATGEAKEINGFQTKQVITTIVMKPKDQTLEQGGGFVMTNDQWLTPRIPGEKEATDFEIRYIKAVGLADMAQEMAAAMAMYPQITEMAKRARVEGDKVEGTPILTTSTFETVMTPEQQKQQESQQAEADSDSGGGGGLGGLLARKMMKKKKTDDSAETANADPAAQKGRAPLMTTTMEVLSLSTDVTDADVSLPEGFKQKTRD